MNKKRPFFITLLAVMLCMAAFSTVAYASEGEESEPTATPSPFTPSGTGTVVDIATDEDGKEFYTIITPDEHVFYLVIDRQQGTENVYFLDVVTEKDLLSLAEGTEDEEPAVSAPASESMPEPTAQPEQNSQTDSEEQSSVGGIVAVALIVAVIAGAAIYILKFRKPKKSDKSKLTLDEYDSDEDEDEEELDEDDAWDDDVETEDDEP